MLSWSMVLLSISTFLFALPNFLIGPYEPFGPNTNVENDSRVCDPDRLDPCVSGSTESTNYYGLFVFSAILTGISAIPVWTTGFAFLESQVEKRTGPFLFGLVNTASGIGVLFGIVGTALMLEIYIDFNRDVEQMTDPSNPNWLG